MLNTESFDADIIVAGAGPSGLVVSCEALLGGARVLTLEKRGEPSWSRAGNLTARVMELFASRGLADRILKRAFELHSEPRSYSGIWAGLPGLHYEVLDTDFPFVLFLSQIEIERMLAEHLQELGGELRLRHEVIDFQQDETGVTVRVRTESEGERTFRARYLVGADGNKSAVRTIAGIPFNGQPASKYAYNVDARIRNPYPDVSTFFHSKAGWAMAYPLRDTVTRLAFIDAQTCREPQSDRPTFEAAMTMLRRVHGSDFDIREVEAITRFHDAMYLAERMRERRVFLVGESVRIHYPASGVGMNFCIQDAFNLGWKLAAVATERAEDGLLDTYEKERRPQIEALLDDVRRQCAVQFNFDNEHAALKRFLEDVLIPMPEVNRKLCENLSGLGARYSRDENSHQSVGQRIANLPLKDADGRDTSVFELLRDQDFLLLDLTGSAAPTALNVAGVKTGSLAGPLTNEALQGAAAVLVRPDGYIAWAGTQPLSQSAPLDELARWIKVTSQPRKVPSSSRPSATTASVAAAAG